MVVLGDTNVVNVPNIAQRRNFKFSFLYLLFTVPVSKQIADASSTIFDASAFSSCWSSRTMPS
jgi:hypothetical protein